MHGVGRGGIHRNRDPLVTVGCLLAIAIALLILWRLGVPLPLLISGLLLSCLLACLLFAFVAARSHKKALGYLEGLREQHAQQKPV